MNTDVGSLGIYIHIPFCVRKCDYCDFLSMKADESEKAEYINSLNKEINEYENKFNCKDSEYIVETVYFGGGTPSCIDCAHIGKIMDLLCARFKFSDKQKPEITLEVNPGTVDKDKLKAYKSYGINRLSIGLQSANDNELRALGRIHSFSEFEKIYDDARMTGFDNINVDIMTAIPYQTLESLAYTVDTVTSLKPEHISAYSLIIEEGTPFYERYGTEGTALFDEETERRMYHETVDRLRESGYFRYEISNFSRKGYESRHNTSYWKRTDYLGFGLGASSLVGNTRYRNTTALSDYINRPSSAEDFEEKTILSREDCMDEFMFLGLRMSAGVSADEFEQKFGVPPGKIYARELERYLKEGLLKYDGRNYCLTDKGVDYGNYVFAGFLR